MAGLDLAWHLAAVMAFMLAAGLIMGQRQVGKLSIFDLITGISIGSVAGSGIVNLEKPAWIPLLGIAGLGILHFLVTWTMKKWHLFGRLATFEPMVVVRNGRPLRQAMARVRLAVGDLMPLLREKDVFDLREVEYGILEPDGTVTVIKSKSAPPSSGLRRAVCVDGTIEPQVLRSLGWDEQKFRTELERQGFFRVEDVFVATLDDAGDLHVVPKETGGQAPAIHH